MGNVMLIIVSCLSLYILIKVLKFFNKVWWAPIRMQNQLRAQGIRGPPYKFMKGNATEMREMRKSAMTTPLDSSNHDMLPRVMPHVYAWMKLYGMNFVNWLGPRPQMVIAEAELVKEMLNNNEGYPKAVIHNFVEKLLGDGLVVSQGEKWAKMRKLANNAFHAESLKAMFPAMISSTESMVEKWRESDGMEIEVYGEFKLLTSEIIARTAFGSSYKEGEKIFDMITNLSMIIAKNHMKVGIPIIRKFVKSEEDKESDRLEQGIREIIINMKNQREKEARKGDPDSYGSDFLGLLLKAHHEADKTKKITLDDLIDECKTFYIGGQETTTSSLTWTFLLLAIHTDWQDKAREEILEFFGKEKPNVDSIGRLKTIGMIVNESLRLYSPVFNITRETSKEIKLGKMVLPAKMAISIPTLILHSNPEFWGDDAHLFKPERFAEGVAKATKSNPAAFLPFGLGPRNCVGMNFAVIEIKLALCMVLQKFRLTLSPNYVHAPIHMLTIRPQHGVQIKLQAL